METAVVSSASAVKRQMAPVNLYASLHAKERMYIANIIKYNASLIKGLVHF